MDATVDILDQPDDISVALELLGKRRGRPFEHIGKFIGDGPQRIYKAIPSKIWMNDADQDKDGDFIKDYRVEINR